MGNASASRGVRKCVRDLDRKDCGHDRSFAKRVRPILRRMHPGRRPKTTRARPTHPRRSILSTFRNKAANRQVAERLAWSIFEYPLDRRARLLVIERWRAERSHRPTIPGQQDRLAGLSRRDELGESHLCVDYSHNLHSFKHTIAAVQSGLVDAPRPTLENGPTKKCRYAGSAHPLGATSVIDLRLAVFSQRETEDWMFLSRPTRLCA